jgi:hypothetical protein
MLLEIKPQIPEKPAKVKILGVDKNRKIQGLFNHLVQK